MLNTFRIYLKHFLYGLYLRTPINSKVTRIENLIYIVTTMKSFATHQLIYLRESELFSILYKGMNEIRYMTYTYYLNDTNVLN